MQCVYQNGLHYLGRKWFQEAGRNLIVAGHSRWGQIQGGGLGNAVSIPSEGRKSAIENHPVRHPGDTFGRIAVPEIFTVLETLKLKGKNLQKSPRNIQPSGWILDYRYSWSHLGQGISFGSKLSASNTNHFFSLMKRKWRRRRDVDSGRNPTENQDP